MSTPEKESRSSDPLPYVQVDRAVRTSVVSPLAGVMGTTPQHALGSLVTWWEMCGRPADLERIVLATPPGKEPAVVLPEDTVRRRWHLASGKEVDPALLVELGLLEAADNETGGPSFRVRGMSRYFGPIRRRLQAREAAKLGGKARAKAPRQGGRFASSSATLTASEDQPTDQPSTSRPPADAPPGNQPSDQHSGQRTADNGQSSSSEEEGAVPVEANGKPAYQFAVVAPDKPVEQWTKEDFWLWAEAKRREVALPGEKWPKPHALAGWWREATAGDRTVEHLREAYYRFAGSPHWQKATPPLPFAGFMSQWRAFLPPVAASGPGSTPCACGCGRASTSVVCEQPMCPQCAGEWHVEAPSVVLFAELVEAAAEWVAGRRERSAA